MNTFKWIYGINGNITNSLILLISRKKTTIIFIVYKKKQEAYVSMSYPFRIGDSRFWGNYIYTQKTCIFNILGLILCLKLHVNNLLVVTSGPTASQSNKVTPHILSLQLGTSFRSLKVSIIFLIQNMLKHYCTLCIKNLYPPPR